MKECRGDDRMKHISRKLNKTTYNNLSGTGDFSTTSSLHSCLPYMQAIGNGSIHIQYPPTSPE